ncbi:MAG: hydrogen gas-evolving membrane-bound hydrogenase subunit E [Moorellales bacterium]
MAARWVGLLFLIFVALVFAAVLGVHPLGRPVATDMDDYFLQNSQLETGANNVVTAIVFDYRGFDTLGEATVLFAAVSAVLAVFRGVKAK